MEKEGGAIMQHRRLPLVMSEEEVKRFFSVIDNRRDRMLVKTIYYCCGLRVSEACALSRGVVDLANKRILIVKPKNGRDRYVIIPDVFYNEFLDYYNDLETYYLFPSYKDKHIGSEWVRHIFKRYLIKAGLNYWYHPHTLRHSFASYVYNKMIEKNGNPNLLVLKEMLGHSSLQTLDVYIHLDTTWIANTLNSVF